MCLFVFTFEYAVVVFSFFLVCFRFAEVLYLKACDPLVIVAIYDSLTGSLTYGAPCTLQMMFDFFVYF